MSIATEISRIQQAKADIKSSIEAKGVTVPSAALIDDYSDYVDAIQTGGGGGTPIAVSKDVSDYNGDIRFCLLKQITDVNWPSEASGAKMIDSYSFYKTSITSITIPNYINYIGTYAFSECSSLTSVTLNNNITTINSGAFLNCTSLTSITIPNSVTELGREAFSHCSSLTSITIPDSITDIAQSLFSSCGNLISITIGNNVAKINNYAFDGCTSLQSVTINTITPPTLANSNAFRNTNNCTIYVPAASVDTYKAASKWSSLASRIQAIPTE